MQNARKQIFDNQASLKPGQYQEALTYLGQLALDETDLNKVFSHTVFFLSKILGTKTIKLWRFLSDGQRIKKIVILEENCLETKAENAIQAEEYLNELLRLHGTLLVNHERKNSFIYKLQQQGSINQACGIIVSIPGEDHEQGFLEAFREKAAPFQETELSFLESVGNILGMAINRNRFERLVQIQNQILKSLYSEKELKQVYNKLCLLLEEEAPGCYCSILLFDPKTNRLRSGAAPTMPEEYAKGVDGIIVKEGSGSCGTAAYRGEAVFVRDINCDPLWADFREFALKHKIYACWSQPFFSEKGELLGTFALSHEVPCKPSGYHLEIIKTATYLASMAHETYKNRKRLIEQAYYDNFTGLANQAFLNKELELILNANAKNETKTKIDFAVLFLDINKAKLEQDCLNQKIAKTALMAFLEKIKILTRENTFVRLQEYRYAILVQVGSAFVSVKKIAEQIRQILENPIKLKELEIYLSVNIAVVGKLDHYKTPSQIIKDGDTALYVAQENPEEPYIIFQTNLHNKVLSPLQLKEDLAEAVDKLVYQDISEFAIYYQPIISLNTNKIIGFEALVRWFHPQGTVINPGSFIPIAEETGLIIPLGKWVFEEACKQFGNLLKKYPLLNNLSLSINVSSSQFHQTNFINQIKDVLAKNQINPTYINLEITESLLLDTSKIITQILQNLRNLGLSLSLDDFGTGYSCLSYLYQLPINSLKIDRFFVGKLGEGRVEIVQAIISLAHSLKMNVIAEGVETEEQKIQLKNLGCTIAQGYLFSVPVPLEMMESMLTNQAFVLNFDS